MKHIGLLLNIQLRARFSLRGLKRDAADPKTRRKGLLTAGLLLFAVGYMLVLYCILLNGLTKALIDFADDAELVLDLVFLLTMAITALFGIFMVLSNLFLSKDTLLLMTLPVKSKHIFLSKFLLVYLTEILFAALFVLPAVIIYMVHTVGFSILLLLRTLYVLLLVPMLPLFAATILASLLMLVVSRFRRRELFTTIASFALVAGVLLGQIYLQSRMLAQVSDTGNGFFAGLIEMGWVKMRQFSLPPFSYYTAATVGGAAQSTIHLVLLTLLSLLVLALLYLLCGSVYRYAVRAGAEHYRKAKKVQLHTLSADSSTPLSAIFRKEWRVMLRTSIYVTNSLAGAFVVVIAFFLPFFLNDRSTLDQFVGSLPPLLSGLILSLAIAFFTTMNMGAYTVLSREGAAFPLLKSLPVPYAAVIRAKLLYGVSLTLVWTLPICIGAVAVLHVPVLSALFALFFGSLLNCAVSLAGTLLDLRQPKLNWRNETEAIKQNFNALIGMLLAVGLLFLFGIGGYLLIARTALPLPLIAVLAILSAAGISLLLYRVAMRIGIRTLTETE